MSNGLGLGVLGGRHTTSTMTVIKCRRKKRYQMIKTSVWDKGMAGPAIKG